MEPDEPTARFLLHAAGARMTVAVLGPVAEEIGAGLAAAVGTTGLVVVVSIQPLRRREGAVIRALPAQTPILSHAADLVLIPSAVAAVEAGALVEEVRRLLAPRGECRFLATGARAAEIEQALRAARFKGVRRDEIGVAARGPR